MSPGVWAAAVVTALMAVIVYLPALANDFVNWDDPAYVYENPALRGWDLRFIGWAFRTMHFGNWHPITWLSYGIDHWLWGLRPFGYHLTSLLFHGVNTLLVVIVAGALAHRAGAGAGGATVLAVAAVGTVFALHPLHVESVAWVSERKDVLYAFFWLSSVLAYLSYVNAERSIARRGRYLLCLGLFALSLMSKPMAVTLPLVLVILDAYPLRRLGPGGSSVRPVIAEKIPFFSLSLGASLITLVAQDRAGSVATVVPAWVRFWNAERALGLYLTRTVAPLDLRPYYALDPAPDPLTWTYLLPLLLVLGLTAVAIQLRTRAPIVLAAWSYYVITLLPVLGIVKAGGQASADRYMYLPLLGPVFVLGAAGAGSWSSWPQRRWWIAALVPLTGIALSVLTVRQIAVWRDSETLWRHLARGCEVASRVAPRDVDACALAFYNLGEFYRDRGDLPSAEKQWRGVVAIKPRHSFALNQLGNLARLAGEPDGAVAYYQRAVDADQGNAEAHYNLAVTLEEIGRPDGALVHYQQFLRHASEEYGHVLQTVREKLGRAGARPGLTGK